MQQTLVKETAQVLTLPITAGATQERADRIALYFETHGIATEVVREAKNGFEWFNVNTGTEQYETAKALFESIRPKRVLVDGHIPLISPAPWDTVVYH